MRRCWKQLRPRRIREWKITGRGHQVALPENSRMKGEGSIRRPGWLGEEVLPHLEPDNMIPKHCLLGVHIRTPVLKARKYKKVKSNIKQDFIFYLPLPDKPWMALFPAFVLSAHFLLRVYKTALLNRKIRGEPICWITSREKTANSPILLLSCLKGSKYQLTYWLRNLWYPQVYWHFWNSCSYLPTGFLIMNKDVPICLVFDLFS